MPETNTEKFTFAELEEFCLAGSPNRQMSSYENVVMIELWEEITKSERLCQIFRSSSWKRKVYIEKDLASGSDPHELASHLSVAYKVIERHFELESILTVDRDKAIRSMFVFLKTREHVSLSREFFDVSEEFLKYKHGSFYRVPEYDLDKCALHMMRVLYGTEFTVSLVKRWMHEECKESVYTLIAIADDWENLQQYPLSWAINLVETDKMRTGSAR